MRHLWLIGLAGCVVGPLSLEGRECPCTTGWRCDQTQNRCVRESEVGESDARPADAGILDAAEDTAALDSGMDASDPSDGDIGDARADGAAADAMADAATMDAGNDASVDSSVDAGMDSGMDATTDAAIDAGIDAGMDTNVPPDVGPPRATSCDGLDVLYCEGFEDGLGSVSIEGGGMSSLSANASMGHSSLELTVPSGTLRRVLKVENVFPSGSSDFWFRGYFYFPSTFDIGYEMMAFHAADRSVELDMMLGETWTNVHAHGTLNDQGWSGDQGVAHDEWVCVEFHMWPLDPGQAGMDLWVDEVLFISSGAEPHSTPLETFEVGIIFQHPMNPTVKMHIDEIAVDTDRIGCN